MILETVWHPAGESGAVPPHQLTELSVAGKRICLLRSPKGLFAFAATCPHAGAALCEGWTDAQGRVVCPLHKYRFNPANGHNTSGEGYKLATFPVKEEEGRIFVKF